MCLDERFELLRKSDISLPRSWFRRLNLQFVPRADAEHQLTTDEVARARSSMSRIRLAMGQALAPPGELVVPKEVEDGVTTAIAWSSEEDTQSLDLVAELVRFGPLAIPVCLQQGYRVPSEKPAYSDIVRAIEQLAKLDSAVAHRSIDKYALSSNMGVRALCWDVCEALHYFPEIMLDSLKGDEGLLLPKERLRIADLCIRFSTKKIGSACARQVHVSRIHLGYRALSRSLHNGCPADA